MHVLLDTHALLWWLDGDNRLSRPAQEDIENEENIIYVSAASAWEIATKVRIGKLPEAVEVANNLFGCILAQNFSALSISVAHAARAGALPCPHRDPFDRMLIAQSQEENLTLISNETLFDQYGVRRLW